MAKAKLVIDGESEIAIEEGIVSIGRASDNTISLDRDSNVSRYHAEIETRAGGTEFWLIELGSSNGTTVNNQTVTGEKLLRDGDLIVLGGTSEILFELERIAPKDSPTETAPPVSAIQTPDVASASVSAVAAPKAEIAADTAKPSKLPLMLAVAGIVCALAIVCVVAAVVISMRGASGCEAKATITSPENGDTISKEIDIEIEAENADCVKRAIFLLDGEEVASADSEPFAAPLDPKRFPQLSDGGDHSLKVAFEDEDGNKIVQPGEVLLAFETLSTPTPTPAPTPVIAGQPTPVKQDVKQTSATEMVEMSKNLVKEFSGGGNYILDPQFLQEVQKKTSEYASEGYFARAQPFQDTINVKFRKENGLDAPLGHILAMSRSKFVAQRQGADEGLWRMNDNFVTTNNYKAACPAESLSDASQACAATAASIYTKALVLKIFGGDVIYAVAAFGMSEQEASLWASTLPADRADFWRAIKPAAQREQVVRFFAAGIVAENPQKFGLKKDRPISELYRNLMGN